MAKSSQNVSKNDFISRNEAIEALGEEPQVWTDSDMEIAHRQQWLWDRAAIEAVPIADVVERKRGQWFYCDTMYTCDQCGATLDDISPFCPMCGADMRGDSNG